MKNFSAIRIISMGIWKFTFKLYSDVDMKYLTMKTKFAIFLSMPNMCHFFEKNYISKLIFTFGCKKNIRVNK